MAMSGEKTGNVNEKDARKAGNLGPHDIGGLEKEYRTIDRSERGFHLWEMQVRPLHPNLGIECGPFGRWFNTVDINSLWQCIGLENLSLYSLIGF